MIENTKITATHLARAAFVYVRQSTTAQVESNRESTERQYRLAERAVELGWRRDRVQVVDDDLGVSGAGLNIRKGFSHLTAEIALGHAGIVLGLEVSRLARSNADWYRLLDLCGVTDTLIGDADGIYHPGMFNDRLVLGLKGTMSEAELHVLRARLQGGKRNKAARGELRCGLPVGYIWGEGDGEVLLHPDEAVVGAIHAVFARFAEMGSARQVWLLFRTQKLQFPLQSNLYDKIRWVAPTYSKIHQVLTNPVYAGVYVYGKTLWECYVDDGGTLRKRRRQLPRSEWAVAIRDHHQGYIDWETFEANQKRIGANTRPYAHEPGGAVREGAALLQGIATCGRCGRKLRVSYNGHNATPGYNCKGSVLANGRAESCFYIGGVQIDEAVTSAFLEAVAPAGLQAALHAAEQLETDHDTALAQWRRQLERARYEAQRAERRYRAVDPDNRLVARGLEAEWERCLRAVKDAEGELAQRERLRPRELSDFERAGILALGDDLQRVWSAPTTTSRERKELLRTLLEEVIVDVDREKQKAHLILRWRGGQLSELDIVPRRSIPAPKRTDEETLSLLRRLAVYYPDDVIAGILNRQGRTTAMGLSFTANRVTNVRTHWGIPCYRPPTEPAQGPLLSMREAAPLLGVSESTLFRFINDGLIPAEQVTFGAPWRIRMTTELRALFAEEAPEGYVPMLDAMRILGVSRQTVLQRVKRGELEAVHVRLGRRKGLRIKVQDAQPGLFDL